MSATHTEAAIAGFGENQVDLATFEVHGQEYAVDVTQIREIVRAQELTPLPKAPVLIEGVVDLRGSVIPVVDLGRALGGDPVEPGPSARIVLIEGDGLVFGLRVGSATEVLGADAGGLEAPPALATQAGYDVVRAVVRRPGAPPVMVLSIEHLLESVFRSALSTHGGEA
jgi:purine-binding chemotaxis protein CheW